MWQTNRVFSGQTSVYEVCRLSTMKQEKAANLHRRSALPAFLGILGVSIGWALFQTIMILTGNVAGWLTGEWRRMEPRISRANLMGVAVLFLAVILIGAANDSVR